MTKVAPAPAADEPQTRRSSRPPDELQTSLETITRGKKVARAQWQVVAIICLGGGLTVLLPCAWLMILCWFGLLPESAGSSLWYACFLLPAVLWILMSAKPQSPRYIVRVATILRWFWASLVLCFLLYAGILAVLSWHVASMHAKATLLVVQFNWVLLSIVCSAGAVGLQPVLNRREALRGSRGLHTVWACARLTIALLGVSTVILYAIAGYGLDPGFEQTRRELAALNGTFTLFDGRWPLQTLRADDPPAAICAGVMYFLVVASLSKANRRRISETISRLSGQSGECRAAAMVAALIGGRSVEEAHQKGKASFFTLPFSALTAADLQREPDAAAGSARRTHRLADLVARSRLGTCDAFISHSWSDRGDAKYHALAEWAETYRRSSVAADAGELHVWLDCACIDQSNIDESLPCLPIFLAGCRRMVILAGATYPSRLWCVVELFVFMQMGGSFDRIHVLPILTEAAADRAQLFAQFGSFRCEGTQCFKAEDKERLLSVIEAGFGGFTDFDALVREVLLNRVATR